jgi:hypothetical protein
MKLHLIHLADASGQLFIIINSAACGSLVLNSCSSEIENISFLGKGNEKLTT